MKDLLFVGGELLGPGGELLLDTVDTLLSGHLATLALDDVVVLDVRLGWTGTVGSDLLVAFFVLFFQVVRAEASLDVSGELLLEELWVFLLEVLHVFRHVVAEDVASVHFGIELLGLVVSTRESVLRVRHSNTAVDGALQGAEDSGTSRGSGKTDVEVRTECTWVLFATVAAFLEEVLAVDLVGTLEGVCELQLGEDSSSDQEAGGVARGVVGQAGADAVPLKLRRVGRFHDVVALDGRVDNLADDLGVGDTNHKTVLSCIVLVLVLEDETTTLLVVGLARSTTVELDLVPHVVGLVLHDFDKRLRVQKRRGGERGEGEGGRGKGKRERAVSIRIIMYGLETLLRFVAVCTHTTRHTYEKTRRAVQKSVDIPLLHETYM